VVLWWIGDGFLDASGSSHSVYLISRTVGIRFQLGNESCIPIPHLCSRIQATLAALQPSEPSAIKLAVIHQMQLGSLAELDSIHRDAHGY